ncbi:hypothetical protein C5U62_11675 [Pseudomonas protegens]|uniref:Uncharacterized protein n=1 Tax=Pseudomonas protegens TaxID=380021 RepID=A0A2T6GPP5_9PSED|nr:hypothetical protein C5U62_11675 [Pseudomonas protegens]RXU60681.1 hypothetical protein CW358_26375 [Pseudomonas protegens]
MPALARRPRRSRLAGEEALGSCIALRDTFAGKPAPTRCVLLCRGGSGSAPWPGTPPDNR